MAVNNQLPSLQLDSIPSYDGNLHTLNIYSEINENLLDSFGNE